jgi:hypothetical protein
MIVSMMKPKRMYDSYHNHHNAGQEGELLPRKAGVFEGLSIQISLSQPKRAAKLECQGH